MKTDTHHLTKPCVFIIDDDPIHLETLSALLCVDYQIVTAGSGEEALAKLDAGTQPNLILLDLILPDHNGFVLCQLLKAGKTTADIPVIFFTVDDDANHEAQGFSIGAADYIKKPADPAVIKARVDRQLHLNQAQQSMANHNQHLYQSLLKASHVETTMSQTAGAEKRIDYLTQIDPASGLPNRYTLQTHWERLLDQHKAIHNPSVTVLMIGLDAFSHIEEALGYHLSDRLLRQVALMLKSNLQAADILVHFNRDEFVAILPGVADTRHAAAHANEIIRLFSHPVCLEQHEISLSVNIGLAHFPSDDQELNTLLQYANKAMRQAKNVRPNTSQTFKQRDRHDIVL